MVSDFLEPERLRAFVTVAETGNFTRAAERLHLTQPAITVQVRRLEDPEPAASREIVLRTLRENNIRWSVRFESASITTLRAALLAA